MKTKNLILGFSMAITFLSNPAIGQQAIGDSPSVKKEAHAHTLIIPWYYPPLYETDASANIPDDPTNYDSVQVDTSDDTCLLPEGMICSSENSQQEQYNNPVEYGIDEYFAVKPNRF